MKGSGWDMGTIEAPGLPAVRLAPLRELVGLQALSDEDMVNVQRCNLLDAKSPNPSVETLLHAFLPHKFIDHTHSNAVLSLTDQPDGEDLARDVFGKRAALVPYIMPGFALAKKASEVVARKSRCRRAGPAEAWHLLDGGNGGGSLRPNDRSGDPGREAPRQGDAQDLRRRRLAQARSRRQPRWRRSCAGSCRCRQSRAAARRRSASCSSSAAGRRSWPMSPAGDRLATASKGR